MMTTELRNIIIIGASSTGAPLARALEKKLPSTHRVVLVDAQAYSYYPVAALRASVVPGWEDKVFADLSSFFTTGSRHVVLPSTRVAYLGEGFVEVDRDNSSKGFGTTISFEICVLATGSTYGAPMRMVAASTTAGKDALRGLQRKINDAQRIVLVGGGTVGIEFAGEILDRYPKKQVTIVQASKRLLSDPWPARLSDRLETDLIGMGAKIIFGQRVTTETLNQQSGTVTLADGQTLEADLIFATAGTTPNSQLVAAQAPSALDARGYVKVNEYLQVASKEGPFASSSKHPYFAGGDVANSPGGATAISAANDAAAIAKNILNLVGGNDSLVKVPSPMNAIIVPIGSKKGRGQMPMVGLVGPWMSRLVKGKSLFVPQWQTNYT